MSVDGYNITVNSFVPVLDEYIISVSIKNTTRESLSCSFRLVTDELPFGIGEASGTEIMHGIEIGTKLSEVYEGFKPGLGYSMEAVNINGNQLTGDDIVSTGTVLKILKNDTVLYEKTIVIYGDCSGDGKVNSTDFMMMKMHIFSQKLLEGVFLEAADVYPGGVVNSTDFMMIKMYIFDQGTISQTRTDN